MEKLFGIGLCLVVGFSAFANEITIDIEKDTTNDGVLDTLEELRDLFEEHQMDWIQIALPGESILFQDYGLVVPFRTKSLPETFTKRLVGEYNSDGIPLYRITCVEDWETRRVLLFDSVNGTELWRLDADPFHDPYSFLRWKFGLSSYDSLKAIDPQEILRLDSAKIAADFTLVPSDFYEDYILAEEQRRLEEIAMAPAMRTMGAGEGSTNAMPIAFSTDTNGLVSLAFTPPANFGAFAEIFKKQSLLYPQLWSVAENRKAVTNGVETVWTDSASASQNAGFFIVSDATADADFDGYSNLREIYVSGTIHTNFNYVDADGDGLHDWFEIMNFGGSITNQSGTDDFDGDGLLNNQEWILHSNSVEIVCDPSEFDTDGDGTDDGTEVAQGGDPSDPGDGGQPPEPPATTPVTLFVQDRSLGYLWGGYTMKLSDGINTYEISSSGLEVVSNTFDVVSGRSYTLTLTSEDFLPYTGAYTATVSGNGLIKDDPENILGVHDDNDTEVDLYPPGKTATVHVMKVDFEAQDGMINYGFDPTGTEPWASVVADSQNPVAQLKVAPVFQGMSIDLVPQDETVAGTDPELCTTAQTPFTLDGLSEGETVLEAKIDDVKIGKLNVHVFEQQNLTVGIYRIYDSRSHSATNISAPSDTIIETTLNEVYQQCGIAFGVSDHGALDIAYDDNLDGIMQDAERYILDQHAWEDDILILVFKTSGIPYGDGTGNMVRGLAFGEYDHYPRGAFYFSDNIPDDDDFALITGHEVGHNLNLDHDEGDYPAGTKPLMMDGAESGGVLPAAPGRWIRQEDWKEANTRAGGMARV